MSLHRYHKKRSFERTPEPQGKIGRSKGPGQFVIQKHDASHLHYDFRLECEGVLKSWAIPKGPSLDPKERRLAVEVEDHPLEYGTFEGTIPEDEYGGGTVLLWDRGRWQPEGDAREGLRKGHLKFRLEGEKLRGGWALVRLRAAAKSEGKEKANWLLIKEKDDEARPHRQGDVLKERPESVASGRALPAIVPPQLATLVSAPPEGDGWFHEIKLDGYRIQASVGGGKARLVTRNGKDWSTKFPSLGAALASLKVDSALFDGEVTVVDADGRTSFQKLQTALRDGHSDQLTYFLFDLLYLNGKDLTARPLAERKRLLRGLLGKRRSPILRFHDHIDGEGGDFYSQACRLGIEGVVAKRSDAPYKSGRGTDWLKVKCLMRQEVVVGGFTAPRGTRSDFGALLVGVYEARTAREAGELRFAGRVGTGFDAPTLRALRSRMEPLLRKTSPFVDPPHGAATRGVRWVEPELVAEVAFTEWTDDDRLRHPSFQGLREDKSARLVRREEPQAPPHPITPRRAPVARPLAAKTSQVGPRTTRRTDLATRKESATDIIAGIELTHSSRILYPDQGLTKLDLATYYQAVAPWILPHLAQRPLSLVRCPRGSTSGCFYQKHLREALPEGVHAIEVEEKDGGHEPYPMVESLPGLVSLVQLGVLELHGWGSSARDIERPDRLVFDLDPDPSVPWRQVVAAAHLLRQSLEELKLRSFVQTTGGKGLHVLVPLTRRWSWDEVKPFARAFAESIVDGNPDRYVSKASKAARKGKIFLDWLRNGRGATAVVPYSTRARAGATVATPLAWDELDRIQPADFTVQTVPARLRALRTDPWSGFWKVRQSVRVAALRRLHLA